MLQKKAEQLLARKRSMTERHWRTIFKLYANSLCRQRAKLEFLKKVTAELIHRYLSLTSELWIKPWVWSNCGVSPELLRDLNPHRNKVK